MPVGNILVGDFGRDIEHDDTALSLSAAYQYEVRRGVGAEWTSVV